MFLANEVPTTDGGANHDASVRFTFWDSCCWASVWATSHEHSRYITWEAGGVHGIGTSRVDGTEPPHIHWDFYSWESHDIPVVVFVVSVVWDHIVWDSDEPTAGIVVKSDMFCKVCVVVWESDYWHPRGTMDETCIVDCKVSRSADVVSSKV